MDNYKNEIENLSKSKVLFTSASKEYERIALALMSIGLQLLCSKVWVSMEVHVLKKIQLHWRLMDNDDSTIIINNNNNKNRKCDEKCASINNFPPPWSQFKNVVIDKKLAQSKKWERIGDTDSVMLGGGKRVFDLAKFHNQAINGDGCIAYSFGSNGDTSYERAVNDKTQCSIFIFDCTLSKDKFKQTKSTLNQQGYYDENKILLFPWCIGGGANLEINSETIDHGLRPRFSVNEIMHMLGHKRIDILKIDVEMAEYVAIASMLHDFSGIKETSLREKLPNIMLVEIHAPVGKNAHLPVNLFLNAMNSLGYALISREDNKFCGDCTEVVFVKK